MRIDFGLLFVSVSSALVSLANIIEAALEGFVVNKGKIVSMDIPKSSA